MNETPDFIASLDQMNSMLRDTAEGFTAHRKKLIDGGVPPEVADEMVKVLHARWSAALFPSAVSIDQLFGR